MSTSKKCALCNRDPERMNSAAAQCSHVDCPHRKLYDETYYQPERESMERDILQGTFRKVPSNRE